ncbi:MAG TPA: glycosyltransferase family 1 protein [Chloroflexota bacterium]|nr:glycosyltransferase family 1 protein [Chloroflexota bacterium]
MVDTVRAALNAHFLHHPTTGSGKYLLHLLVALRRVAPDVEALPFCSGTPPVPAGGWPKGTVPVLAPTPFGGLGGDLPKVWWEQVIWPRLAVRVGAVVGHVPYFAPPLARPEGLPLVVTIHDLIPLIIPEYVTTPLVRLYNSLVCAGARRAELVLVDSQASRQDVVRLLGIPEERVRVVYLAADEAVLQPPAEGQVEAVKQRYGLHAPYIFYLGGLDKRKHVQALLRAAAALPARLPWQLVISGKLPRHNPRLFPDLPAIAESLGIAERVRFVFVPDEDKVAMYHGATCFAFPSVYEGFGLDPLEALACGTPVVCSNRSCLPEMMGEAALMVDPDDTPAFADALRRVLTDAELRAELAGRGPVQARKFSWDLTAQQTLAAYREAEATGIAAAAVAERGAA